MENYNLKERYEDEDEIDLVDLLKTIVKERKLIGIITLIVTLIAFGFAIYKESLPRKYKAIIKADKYVQEIPLYQEDLKKEILNHIQQTGLLSSELKKVENKESYYNEFSDLKTLFEKEYEYKDITKEKELAVVEKQLGEKIDNLNNDINNLLKERADEKIKELDEKINVLKEEAKTLDEKIKTLVEKHKGITENISENIGYLDPVLNAEISKNKEQLENNYKDMQKMQSFKEMIEKDNAVALNIENIDFDKSKLNGSLIVILGIILGLGLGMFVAIIKEPTREVLKEVNKK
ncbi:Wzz/FepE/Etk N-terminal domain-containing protein [Fusobacterium sp.]|uniref:Wzz/FepE/Etk N-terminal domain-containing protein n=1 Tax=Fusobacterium sp. TaxID=68766 RepID=UPI0026215168|nr:Wzz/FepE/Etk N-terminal domain-containing protein [Fusobacterium sp.]